MNATRSRSCPECQSLRQELAALKARLATLEAQLAASQKNSSNSSKPPSSDIVKPPRERRQKGKRRRGGQPGHPRHVRPAFAPEAIDERIDYVLDRCPDCGGQTTPLDGVPRVVQQAEIVVKPIHVSEHRGHACFCRRCQKTHYAPIPAPVRRAGLVGPRLTAIVAYLKGGCHCSFTTIRKFVRDVLGLTISRSQLRKVCAKVADSLDTAYDELRAALPNQGVIHADETGHKEYKQRLWTWCFRASIFTLFKIDPSRGSDVLIKVLGRNFDGVLGCDYFSAYRAYMGECSVEVQFCLAHLLRDVRFLVEHPDKRNRAYGRRVLEAMRALFGVIHDRQTYTPERFGAELQNAGDEMWAQAVYRVPNVKQARNLARRFEKHGQAYLKFITTPGVEPTNNLAEQAIRFVVIDRYVTGGSRSEGGRRWLERIWTTLASCHQQSRSAFTFLADTVAAFFQGQPTPSLLPDTS